MQVGIFYFRYMKYIVAPLFLFLFFSVNAQITLTHNIGNDLVDSGMTTCNYEEIWGRTFTLSEFGITTNEQFIIRSGQVAVSNAYEGAMLHFGISIIDSGFPNSVSTYIGGFFGRAPEIGDTPEIVNVEFPIPIVVPAGVERILVEVSQIEDIYNPDYKKVRVAGTLQDNDVSWFRGCREHYVHVPTSDLSPPVPNANYFINVTGDTYSTFNYGSTTTLTYYSCDNNLRRNDIYACSWGGINWGRTYTLADFGISNNEEYVIESGQIALADVGSWDVNIQFNIYKIDDDFPTSFSDTDLIGSSQSVRIPDFGRNPNLFIVEFDTPVVVPADVDKILVEVFQLHSSSSGAVAFTAGADQFIGDSWFRSSNGGCPPSTYTRTSDLGYGDTNFFINVTGKVNHVTNEFEMNISNICSEFLKEFSVSNSNDVASITWNFGDPASGAQNTSTDLSPFHDFTSDGNYTITATITANDGRIEVLTETIEVKEPPNIYGINNLEACEDNIGTGFSSTFDTSNVQSQLVGSQSNSIITYIDGSGNEYTTLPNPFTNTVRDRETITVRVSRSDELCCYSETTFDLIINPLPGLSIVEDLSECDNDYDGITLFDLSQTEADLNGGDPNILVEFYHEDGTAITTTSIENKIIDKERITAKITNLITNCSNQTNFEIIVLPLPFANPIPDIIGCDDNGDGISEYFDISNVENFVLGNQTGLVVSYYDNMGALIPSPLPNPFTNTIPFEERITVRLTNPVTSCYAETELVLKTSVKPSINTPSDIYLCDEGNGFATFDLGNITNEIIGVQNNLNVHFYDVSGNEITDTISSSFVNTNAWHQTINVKVINALSPACFSETSFDLYVNELPEMGLLENYFLCNLEPSLPLSVDTNFNSWEWKFEDGTIISNSFNANLIEAGNYSLTVTEIKNGIECDNTFNFELIRSILPTIDHVEFQELSDDNYIRIIASGDGDFEYSIDGINFQDENQFNDLLGGLYTVYVRDKFGCGEDSQTITLIDYPKFFTPNGDGYNDYWQIKGIQEYPESQIHIFDRYGKLLKQISPTSIGWDGTFNGELLPSSDYWFILQLDNLQKVSGHFTLKR